MVLVPVLLIHLNAWSAYPVIHLSVFHCTTIKVVAQINIYIQIFFSLCLSCLCWINQSFYHLSLYIWPANSSIHAGSGVCLCCISTYCTKLCCLHIDLTLCFSVQIKWGLHGSRRIHLKFSGLPLSMVAWIGLKCIERVKALWRKFFCLPGGLKWKDLQWSPCSDKWISVAVFVLFECITLQYISGHDIGRDGWSSKTFQMSINLSTLLYLLHLMDGVDCRHNLAIVRSRDEQKMQK